MQGFAVITAIVVWGAIPFVAITVYAGLTQLPRELVEAAEVDGANPVRVFRDMTLPILKADLRHPHEPVGDLGLPGLHADLGDPNYRPESDYYLISIYSFVTSFNQSEYGLGSAIALVMVLIMLGVTFFYIRQMVRLGEMD
jgi:N,N'-diacetylchitobiose transport system permease protein